MKSIKKLMLLSGILLSVSAFSFTFQGYKFQSPAVLKTITLLLILAMKK